MQDIIDKYYREGEKRRKDNAENPNRAASLARDTNNTIFSFNFGLSLLDSFIKVEFEPIFGLSILESFIS